MWLVLELATVFVCQFANELLPRFRLFFQLVTRLCFSTSVSRVRLLRRRCPTCNTTCPRETREHLEKVQVSYKPWLSLAGHSTRANTRAIRACLLCAMHARYVRSLLLPFPFTAQESTKLWVRRASCACRGLVCVQSAVWFGLVEYQEVVLVCIHAAFFAQQSVNDV